MEVEVFISQIKDLLDKTKIPGNYFLKAKVVEIREPVSEKAPYHIILRDSKDSEIDASLFQKDYNDTEAYKEKVAKFVSLKGRRVKITKIGKRNNYKEQKQLQLGNTFEFEVLNGNNIPKTIEPRLSNVRRDPFNVLLGDLEALYNLMNDKMEFKLPPNAEEVILIGKIKDLIT